MENQNVQTNEMHQADGNIASIISQAQTDPALSPGQNPATSGKTEISEPVPDYEGQATELLEYAYDSLTPFYPRLTTVYTPEVRAKLAARSARLMQKYGLTAGDLLEKWGPELGFAMVVLPLIGKTAQAIKADNADNAAANGKNPDPEKAKPIEETGLQPIIDKTDADSLHNRA